MERARLGIIGAGMIFGAYAKGCRSFQILEAAACADLDHGLARAKAAEFDIPRVCSVKELLADPEIDIVINLTPPQSHAGVSIAALEAGKHVYSEKPLAVERRDGQQIMATAREKGLRVGCAPDTFLGGGLQTCRKLLDDGWIGEPVAATAFFVNHGPEAWHLNPAFFYQAGAGPLFDVGPYYLTALIHLLGPVVQIGGMARISFPERIATSPGHLNERIPVEVPTHLSGVLEFASGPLATLITSFDVWASDLPRIEIYGSQGTLSVPDPNIFGGDVRVWRAGAGEWSQIPLTHSSDVGRGIGVADLAHAVAAGRSHRARGSMAFHVLDIMHALGESAQSGRHVEIESSCTRPAPLPLGLPVGELDS